MIYVLSIIVLMLLVFLGWQEFHRADNSVRLFFIPGLLFKLICGIGVGVLYTYYYSNGDTFIFFLDGKTIAGLALESPVDFVKFLWAGNENFKIWSALVNTQPRALFFSKLSAIGYLLSFGNYWGVAVLFSFISFFSAWKLTEVVIRYYPGMRLAVVTAFLFFPSTVFWSSGLMKESIAMSGMYALLAGFIGWWNLRKFRLPDALVVATGFWLLWNLKYYYAGVLLMALAGISMVRFLLWRKPIHSRLAVIIIYLVVLIIPTILVTELHPNFDTSRILGVIVKNYDAYRVISNPENLITYYRLSASPVSILLNMPWAFISGLFQPFIWNTKSLLQFFSGMESFAVLVLFVGALRRGGPVAMRTPDFLLLLGIASYIGLLAIFLSLSTPNVGTLVRYRVGFYPFLMVLLFHANPWLLRTKRFTGR